MYDLDAITAQLHDMADTRYRLAQSPRSEHQRKHLLEDAEALRAAARAIEKLRGIKIMGGKPLLACVQVVGPDDVIPAPDGMTAIVWANRINAMLARMPKPNPESPHWPKVRAQACLWPHDDASHAEGPGEEYAWLLKDDG